MPTVRHSRRPPLTPVVSIVVVLLMAVLGFFLSKTYVQYQQRQLANRAQATWQEAQALDSRGSYNSEYVLLQNYMDSQPPKQYRLRVLVQLGTLAINRKDYKDALKWYQQAKAVSSKPDINVLVGAAVAEAQLGSKQAAIDDYKQAIKIAQASPNYQVDPDGSLEGYKEAVRQLGGTP